MGHSASSLYRINNLGHRFISIKILEEKRVVIAAVWPPIPGCLEMKREPFNLFFSRRLCPGSGDLHRCCIIHMAQRWWRGSADATCARRTKKANVLNKRFIMFSKPRLWSAHRADKLPGSVSGRLGRGSYLSLREQRVLCCGASCWRISGTEAKIALINLMPIVLR